MNISNLQILLQKSINEANTTIDYLFLSRAVESLNMGQVRKVATFGNLPTASTNKGLLVYVEADERIYYSNGSVWTNIIDSSTYTAWAWGSGLQGQLGNNTASNRSSPVSVVSNYNDWRQISSGRQFSLAIRNNGTAWAWGINTSGSGQLGDNSTTNRISPVSVVGGFTDWCQLSAGHFHSLGFRSNGTVWAWGQNTYGQLGDGTTTGRSSPVLVSGGFTDWCQISAGYRHSLGVRSNGTVWVWGRNNNGQLGDNSTTNKSSPVSVVGGFTDWCQVSAGYRHSLGVRSNGTVWAWGQNTFGQIGDNTTTDRSSPVSVVGGITDWRQITAGACHNLALRSNGTLWAWGGNGAGQLGDNSTTSKSSPISVVGGFTNWCQVSAGTSHSAAIRTDGSLWNWGDNSSGQLGDNSTIGKSSPISVVGGFTNWCQVSAGFNHTLALKFLTN